MPTKRDDSEDREISHAMGLFFQLGLTMAVCVLVGVLLGRFLDRVFGTPPSLLIIFALLGGAAAMKVLYDTAVKRWK